MRQIYTEIEIQAKPEKVWQILSDNKSWQDWNPFIVRSTGEMKEGGKIINTMKNGDKDMVFKPVITEFTENERLEWVGHLFIPGLFDGRHYFELEETEDGNTHLIHGEKFSGLFAGLILSMIESDTVKGFESLNQALKERCENKAK